MTCTRCAGSGFLNFAQVPSDVAEPGHDAIQEWRKTDEGEASDVAVCDCCGDGESWYGEPGTHYSGQDPAGDYGPYAYNGGVAECH